MVARRSALLASLLGPCLFGADSPGLGDPPSPWPEELALVQDAVPGRREQFFAGRACAHRALKDVGADTGPVTWDDRGGPIWPSGIVGTITHCAGYAAAAVGRVTHIRGVGLDAEPHRPLPEGVGGLVFNVDDCKELSRPGRSPEISWDLLSFCAKEAAYKALYPSYRRWIDFKAAFVGFEPPDALVAHVAGLPGGEVIVRGRWAIAGTVAVVAVTVPAD